VRTAISRRGVACSASPTISAPRKALDAAMSLFIAVCNAASPVTARQARSANRPHGDACLPARPPCPPAQRRLPRVTRREASASRARSRRAVRHRRRTSATSPEGAASSVSSTPTARTASDAGATPSRVDVANAWSPRTAPRAGSTEPATSLLSNARIACRVQVSSAAVLYGARRAARAALAHRAAHALTGTSARPARATSAPSSVREFE
jgi:hypothetical protein